MNKNTKATGRIESVLQDSVKYYAGRVPYQNLNHYGQTRIHEKNKNILMGMIIAYRSLGHLQGDVKAIFTKYSDLYDEYAYHYSHNKED